MSELESKAKGSGYEKPYPLRDRFTQPFWEYTKKHEFRMQHCKKCGTYQFPATPACPQCLSEDLEWKLMSGRGKVLSWVVYHQLYLPGFRDDMPYNVASVELDEGPLFVGRILGIPNEEIQFDMPVEVVWDDAAPDLTLPQWKPVGR